MARRVLLIELQAQTPGVDTFATWNASDKTANATLSGGNLIVTAAATANYNAVRATVGLTSGAHYWETTHTFAAGAGYVLSAGICTALFGFSATQLGTDVAKLSAGGPGQDGNARYNNVAIDLGTVATTNTVRHWLDLDAGTYKCAIAGGAWFTVGAGINLAKTDIGVAWYPVAQFTTIAHAITANFGATAFVYTVPDGARSGVFSTGAASAATVYFASEFVLTDAASTPANTLYEGRLLASSNPALNRSAGCWVWGDEAKIAIGELEFANADGALDYMRAQIVRDRPVVMRYGTPTEARNPATCATWAQTIADRVEFTEAGTMRLIMADKMAMLDKPVTRAVFPSWIPETVLVDRPKPVCIGTAYSVDPVLVDPALLYFDAHDDAVTYVDEVFDQADIDVLTTDYYQRNTGFDKHAVPAGKMTATVRGALKRASTFFAEPFTAWVAGAFDNNPSGWTVSGELDATRRVYESTAGRCRFKNSTAVKLYMERNIALVAGTTYIVTFDVTAWTSGALWVQLWNGAVESGVYFVLDGSKRTGTHSVAITPTAGYATLRLVAAANQNCDIEIESLTVYVATHISRMPDFLTELCVTRGGLAPADIDTAGTIAALDALAPYGLGFYTRDATMIRQIVRDVMRSFCGWLVPNRDGVLTVGRLQRPSATAVLAITEADLAGIPVCTPDAAKGLTTVIGAQRNWSIHSDADFAGSVTAQTRAALKKVHRESRKAAGTVDPFYGHADTAPELATLLQVAADAQAEASRMATLYSVPRYFYAVPVFIDLAAALALKPGETLSVTAPFFDLTAGKKLIAVGIEQQFFSSIVRLILWG